MRIRTLLLSSLGIWATLVTLAVHGSEGSCGASNAPEQTLSKEPPKESTTSSCGCSQGTQRASNAANKAAPNPPEHNDVDPKSNPSEERRVVLPEALIETYRSHPFPSVLDIPGGEFIMGTTVIENPTDGEGPPRRVRVSDFALHEKEVSIADFARFVIETGHETEAETFGWSFCFERTLSKAVLKQIEMAVAQVPWWLPVNGSNWLFPNGPDQSAYPDKMDHPVTHVSHNDAKAYCEWLDMRLPTEAEFEYAMRGGLENKTYPWGDEMIPNGQHRANLWQGHFPEKNTVEDGFEYSAPVSAFGPQNAFGLYNIVGNAWEWVADAWITNHARLGLDKVLVDPQVEIQGKVDAKDTERVKRGGSYMCHKSYCLRYRTSSRSSNSADSSAQNLGFRCAV